MRDKETGEQPTCRHSKSGSHLTSPKKSNQCQRELNISKLKREQLAKQHPAVLTLLNNVLRLIKECRSRTKMELQQLEEEHCKQLAGAAIEQNLLMKNLSQDGPTQVI